MVGLESALRITQSLFNGEIGALTESDFLQLKQDGLPSTLEVTESLSLVDVLVKSGLAASNKMAREFIVNGAVSINGVKLLDPSAVLSWEQALFGRYLLLRKGKKYFHLSYRP